MKYSSFISGSKIRSVDGISGRTTCWWRRTSSCSRMKTRLSALASERLSFDRRRTRVRPLKDDGQLESGSTVGGLVLRCTTSRFRLNLSGRKHLKCVVDKRFEGRLLWCRFTVKYPFHSHNVPWKKKDEQVLVEGSPFWKGRFQPSPDWLTDAVGSQSRAAPQPARVWLDQGH